MLIVVMLCDRVLWEVFFDTLCFPSLLQWNELLWKILEAVNILWQMTRVAIWGRHCCSLSSINSPPPSSQQSTKFVYSRELSFFASQHMTFFGRRFVETVRWTPWGWSPCWGPWVETWKELALGDAESLPLSCLNPSLPWTPQFCEIGRFLSLKQVRCPTAKSILIGREFITGNR